MSSFPEIVFIHRYTAAVVYSPCTDSRVFTMRMFTKYCCLLYPLLPTLLLPPLLLLLCDM